MNETLSLPLSLIYANPNQPRKDFDEGKLNELAASITQYGVLEPIVVTPRADRYMIIAGERRYRASMIAGIEEIPARGIDADDALVEELALLENIQREDLNVIEIALAYKNLIDRGWTKGELGAKMGFQQTWRIDENLALLNFSEEKPRLVVCGTLSNAQAQEMARLSHARQNIVRERILSGALPTYNKLRAFVDGLILAENQSNLFVLETVSDEERAAIDRVGSLLTTIERLIADTAPSNMKKAAYHSAITAQRIDLIIQHLMKLRKFAISGEAIKQAVSSAGVC